MAAQPPPEPNQSVDLKAAAAAASSTSSKEKTSNGSSDIQTDGAIMAQAVSPAVRGFPLPNVQSGLPPINPAQFSQFYMPHIHQPYSRIDGANIFNISNSRNIQIGRTNVMNFTLGQNGPTPSHFEAESSDSEDEMPAIEESKLQELRRCEREISNIELQDIAQHVGLGWRRLIRFLGLQDYDVDELYEEYGNHGLEEVIYQLLKRWKSEVANPTVSEVLYQIQRCDMGHLAQYLRNDISLDADGNIQ